jgi:uncharacterized membrane protein HdeD (DUF308 family)
MSAASVTKNTWWALVLGGLASLLFGVAVVFWPGLTVLVLIYLFSSYVLISGVVNVLSGISVTSINDTWFLPVIMGVVELGVGVYLLRHTTVKFTTLIVLIGFTLIARGLIEAVNVYYSTKQAVKLQALGYIAGLAGLVAGIVILFTKQSAGVSFVWILGVYAIVLGVLHLAITADTEN